MKINFLAWCRVQGYERESLLVVTGRSLHSPPLQRPGGVAVSQGPGSSGRERRRGPAPAGPSCPQPPAHPAPSPRTSSPHTAQHVCPDMLYSPCRPPAPQPPISGRQLAFPICELLSFGRELLPSVLWTIKQVFINKLR